MFKNGVNDNMEERCRSKRISSNGISVGSMVKGTEVIEINVLSTQNLCDRILSVSRIYREPEGWWIFHGAQSPYKGSYLNPGLVGTDNFGTHGVNGFTQRFHRRIGECFVCTFLGSSRIEV